jgi:regulator of ribonuclease activity A
MAGFATTDLCDAHEKLLDTGALTVLAPGFLLLGRRSSFAGPAHTLQVFEDNTLVRSTLETPGGGRVLVVDGAASLRCALVGGKLALLGASNQWAGIVINGCVRDALEIEACDIGVRALALNPRRSAKRGGGQAGIVLHFAGARIAPGDWIYSDRDGILAAQGALPA